MGDGKCVRITEMMTQTYYQPLNYEDLRTIFEKMEQALAGLNVKKEYLVIGSAVLIQDGMPDRSTMDIDVWKTNEADRKILEILAESAGLELDPEKGLPLDRPHFQWVDPLFVNMPERCHWDQDTDTMFEGKYLRLTQPPVGVMLGSKLSTFRAKDISDIHWLVDNNPNWREDLDKWFPVFEEKDQKEIDRNLIFVEYHIEHKNRRTIDAPEEHASKILPRRMGVRV